MKIAKKRLWILILAAVLALSCAGLSAGAQSAEQKNTADALYQMGLFLGTGDSYALDKTLTRNQGVILLVRMLGKEEEAQSLPYTAPFADVAEAAKPHVSYAYANKLTNGITATSFGGAKSLSDKQFYALVLRALGYSDSGENPDFKYADTRAMAAKVGLTNSAAADISFTRGEVVTVFWQALHTPMKGSTETMAEKLLRQGVFTAEDLSAAERIRENGLSAGDESGEKRPETPVEVPTIDPQDPTPELPGGEDPCTHPRAAETVAKEATCTTAGIRSCTCSDCGTVWTETIPALGHEYRDGVCTRCGEKDANYTYEVPGGDGGFELPPMVG